MSQAFLTCIEIPAGVQVSGFDEGGHATLQPGKALRIGVTPACDVRITGIDIGGRVNCILVAGDDGICRLSHAGHPRPILINGQKLMPLSASRVLVDGDVIEPVSHDGPVPRFVFHGDSAAASDDDQATGKTGAVKPPPPTQPRADQTWRPPQGFRIFSGRAQDKGGNYVRIAYDETPLADLMFSETDGEVLVSLYPPGDAKLSFALSDFERILAQARAHLLSLRTSPHIRRTDL